jgi:hypothetical protein
MGNKKAAGQGTRAANQRTQGNCSTLRTPWRVDVAPLDLAERIVRAPALDARLSLLEPVPGNVAEWVADYAIWRLGAVAARLSGPDRASLLAAVPLPWVPLIAAWAQALHSDPRSHEAAYLGAA